MRPVLQKSTTQKAFCHYLRTGHMMPEENVSADPEIELKFNPNHDASNGQFTFAPGEAQTNQWHTPGSGRSSHDRVVAARGERRNTGRPLGILSARYESGGNAGTVSSGRGDAGGVFYGTYQFATQTGDAAAVVASPEFRPWAREFHDLSPGTEAFGNKWRVVATRDPKAFGEAQHAYVSRTHYEPVIRGVDGNTGYNLDNASDAVRNATWSVSVQHGAATRILTDAVRQTDKALPRNDPGYEAALIGNIYDRRTAHVTAVRDKAISNGKAKYAINLKIIIQKCYRRERVDALRMLSEGY